MRTVHCTGRVLMLAFLLAGCGADADKRIGAGAFTGACLGAFGGPVGAGVGFGVGATVGALAPADTYKIN